MPRRMRIERVRIRLVVRGEDPARWADAIADPGWLDTGEVLKDEPGSSWVRRAMLGGREVVVKCRLLGPVSRRLKSALGFGHGNRHWRGAAMLAAKKVPTARPIALVSATIDGAPVELLVLEYLRGRSLLQVLSTLHADAAAMPVRVQHALAASVGAQVGRLAHAGLLNRDHKPSNIIITHPGDGPAVIDAVGVRSCGARAGLAAAARMCASLVIEPTGCGVPPRRALMMRAVRAAVSQWTGADDSRAARGGVRSLWREAVDRVGAHGDPRPKVDPLAP